MGIALNLVDSFAKHSKEPCATVLLDVGSGVIEVTQKMAQEAAARGLGTIVGKPHSLFGYERG